MAGGQNTFFFAQGLGRALASVPRARLGTSWGLRAAGQGRKVCCALARKRKPLQSFPEHVGHRSLRPGSRRGLGRSLGHCMTGPSRWAPGRIRGATQRRPGCEGQHSSKGSLAKCLRQRDSSRPRADLLAGISWPTGILRLLGQRGRRSAAGTRAVALGTCSCNWLQVAALGKARPAHDDWGG